MEHYNSNGEPIYNNNNGNNNMNGNEVRRNNRSVWTIFWGFIFIFGAISLIVNRMGYFEEFSLWPIVFSIGFAALMIEGMIKRSFGQILFSIAFLVIVNDDLLHMQAITPWTVLIAALLGTIGLNILFPGFKKKDSDKYNDWCRRNSVDSENVDGSNVYFNNKFGSSVKYMSGNVSNANIQSSFGALEVYLKDANLVNNTAYINVKASFGELTLHIPADWKVVLDVQSSFADVHESGHCNPAGDKVVYISGSASFGSLQINYI